MAFGGVHAVDDVTVDLYPGEVVGLVGGNGAGKTTLIRTLSGAHPADSGTILLNGEPVTITSPRDAKALGVETIYQTLALADNVDAPANVFLGRELTTRFGNLDDSAMEDATRKLMNRLNPKFKNFVVPVASLSGGQRQSVAIASRPVQREDPDHGRADRRARACGDRPGAGGDPAAETGGDRHLLDQPRHPRRVRPVRSHQRHAPRQDGRHGQEEQDVTVDEVLAMIILGKKPGEMTQKDLAELH